MSKITQVCYRMYKIPSNTMKLAFLDAFGKVPAQKWRLEVAAIQACYLYIETRGSGILLVVGKGSAKKKCRLHSTWEEIVLVLTASTNARNVFRSEFIAAFRQIFTEFQCTFFSYQRSRSKLKIAEPKLNMIEP